MVERRLLILLTFLTGCHAIEDPLPQGEAARFLNSKTFRRTRLEQSLVNKSNGYSALRLNKYATESGGWEALEVYNPAAKPMTISPIDEDFSVIDPGVNVEDTNALIELGRIVFERYPLSSAEELREGGPGVWTDDRGYVGGLVLVKSPGGDTLSKSCATCHARTDEGRLVYGASNTNFDLGRALFDAGRAGQNALSWGPGHVDPTPDGLDNPTGITDLRPIRYQNHLNVAATVKNDPIALAIRIETLMITSAGERHRPPRIFALAIAYFLWSLGEPTGTPSQSEGATLFAQNCGNCHHTDFSTAAPVPLSVVGTEPLAGRSPMRGTGRYRIPSLFKVADRHRLLHQGQVDSLSTLLSEERLSSTPGHPFGLGLEETQKSALIDFLGTLY